MHCTYCTVTANNDWRSNLTWLTLVHSWSILRAYFVATAYMHRTYVRMSNVRSRCKCVLASRHLFQFDGVTATSGVFQLTFYESSVPGYYKLGRCLTQHKLGQPGTIFMRNFGQAIKCRRVELVILKVGFKDRMTLIAAETCYTNTNLLNTNSKGYLTMLF